MSYTTEVKIKVNLSADTPKSIINFINGCIERNNTSKYDNHPFFNTERWLSIFMTFGFDGYTKPYIKESSSGWELALHSDINYEKEEVSLFVDWIKAYIVGRKKKKYLGWFRRDGEQEETNIYLIRDNV